MRFPFDFARLEPSLVHSLLWADSLPTDLPSATRLAAETVMWLTPGQLSDSQEKDALRSYATISAWFEAGKPVARISPPEFTQLVATQLDPNITVLKLFGRTPAQLIILPENSVIDHDGNSYELILVSKIDKGKQYRLNDERMPTSVYEQTFLSVFAYSKGHACATVHSFLPVSKSDRLKEITKKAGALEHHVDLNTVVMRPMRHDEKAFSTIIRDLALTFLILRTNR